MNAKVLLLAIVCAACLSWSDAFRFPFQLHGKVINGTVASRNGNEHQVSIRLKKDDYFFGAGHICGGSLISSHAVLTAAHCLLDSSKKQFRAAEELIVAMGILDLYDVDNAHQFLVTHYEYVEGFNGTTYKNDMAILFLSKYVPRNATDITIISLATEAVRPGTACSITGWGKTDPEIEYISDVLMTANVSIISEDTCRLNYQDTLLDGMMCAGFMKGEIDACQGDSGGPLVCGDKLVGVISTGNGCALEGYPGIYANVSYYHKWITDTLQKNPLIEVETGYEVSIHYKSQTEMQAMTHICSGSVVSRDHILTAASCLLRPDELEFYNASEIYVALDSKNLWTIEYTIDVEEIKIFQDFNETTLDNDLAILFLNKTIEDKIPEMNVSTVANKAGDLCTVNGWGDPLENFSNSMLVSVQVRILDGDTCKELHTNRSVGTVCGAYFQGGTNACKVDRGSPLISNGKIVGLASQFVGCETNGKPTLFTDTVKRAKWINTEIGKDNGSRFGASLVIILAALAVFLFDFLKI